MRLETKTIDKLFLELSQFTNATTAKELVLARHLQECVEYLESFTSEGDYPDVEQFISSCRAVLGKAKGV